jgi:AcrR family transcriptional regulator
LKGEPKRERIVREATRQFAEKGYERTTVADIQAASGLSPNAGGLYRHFSSKEALLEEAVLRVITSFEGRAQKLGQDIDSDVDAFLQMVGQAVLDDFAEERDSVRIVLRDLDQFPHLQAAFRERRLRPSFKGLSAWLQAQVEAGRLREHDSDATAVLILGSLIFVRITEALMGEPPVRVADSRLLKAWLDLIVSGLAPTDNSSPSAVG